MSISKAQKRASFAFNQVNLIRDPEDADRVKTEAAKFISLILNSGLLQAMGFAWRKLEKAYKHLNDWIAIEDSETGTGLPLNIIRAAKEGSINQELAKVGKEEYRLVMQEALAFLEWLKSKADGKKVQLTYCSLKTKETEQEKQP
ncbi:MAG: type III-B CRISPR module-associated protein Cmr5 [Candidatus Jettenia sp.]|nr:type III-B CRISPR module-associated protein Cmr5 [Candidatus Jettenia sp.]